MMMRTVQNQMKGQTKTMNKKIINKYISAQSNGKVGELYILGEITDEKWYQEDVTPTVIKNTLEEMGDINTLEIHIHSGGGSVFAGLAIIGVIENYKSKNSCKTVSIVEGLAASMASIIACSADKKVMKENAFIMIHPAASVAWGNAEKLRHTADLLEKVDGQLRDIYMKSFNGTREQLDELVDNETWLTAKEAKDYNLCDEIQESIKIAACANGIIFNNVNFDKKILDKIKSANPDIKITQESEENKKVLIYDAKLTEFGITEEAFNAFENVNDFIDKVVNKAREGYVANKDIPEPITPYITSEMVKDKLGKELTADELLNMANKATELEGIKNKFDDITNKFESIRQEAIENAITNGIRANEKFDETKWKKRLDSMGYDEIKDISNEWLENAKESLKAGVRVSKITDTNKQIITNKDNYNF